MRCAGLLQLRMERGTFHPGAGKLHARELLFALSLCRLHSAKEGQGNARALLRRELGPNYKQMFFDKYWGEGIWLRDRCFHLWRTFSQRPPVRALQFLFLPPLCPQSQGIPAVAQASCSQWHLLSVAIKNLNVNIFALKWMEKYLSLSGNHSSNKRLARQGP